MRVIELGNGTVRITPCFVSSEDHRQALLFEPEQELQKIGRLTGKPSGNLITQPKDTLIILGCVEAGEVLLRQVCRCVEEMRPNEVTDDAKEYKIELVKDLAKHVKKRNELSDKFDELFGGFMGNGDCYYSRFMDDLFDDQIKLVAEMIGDRKEGLEWFVYDNECGDKGLEAGVDGDMRKIKTVDDYIYLIKKQSEI